MSLCPHVSMFQCLRVLWTEPERMVCPQHRVCSGMRRWAMGKMPAENGGKLEGRLIVVCSLTADMTTGGGVFRAFFGRFLLTQLTNIQLTLHYVKNEP